MRSIIIPRPQPVLGSHFLRIGFEQARFDELDRAVVATYGMGMHDLERNDPTEAMGVIKTEGIEQVIGLLASADGMELTFGDERLEVTSHDPTSKKTVRSTLSRLITPLPVAETVEARYQVAPAYDVRLRPPLQIANRMFTVHPLGQ